MDGPDSREGWWLVLACFALAGAGCHHDKLAADAGPPPACQAPPDCKLAGYDGACRGGVCVADVPCLDDVECGLGESCAAHQCRFTGCVTNADCPSGACRTASYACAECGQSSDCPPAKPICSASGACTECGSDLDCLPPGPAICDASGTCVQCVQDVQCPNGLSCGADHACHGSVVNGVCSQTVLCDTGLVCVTINGGQSECLPGCDLYTPVCPGGQICYKLGFTGSPALVFDNGAPLGVCSAPLPGLKSYGQTCNAQAPCEPNLACIPDTPQSATCHGYCDPRAPACPTGQNCHTFPGDFNGHRYGVCYADTGWGASCTADLGCDGGQACVPLDDPSSLSGLSDFCAFDVGTQSAMSPCDAGSMPSTCASGYCVPQDPFGSGVGAAACFGACSTDSDCQVDGGVPGTCMGLVSFNSQFVMGVTMSACLPWCADGAACARYGAGLTCRLAVALNPVQQEELLQTCDGPAGPQGPGGGCLSDGDCRDGYCLLLDGRGVDRKGVCLTPCSSGADCLGADAGADAGDLTCAPHVLFGSLGPDGVAGTADDTDFVTSACTGVPCGDDTDCSAPFTRCTVDLSAAAPATALVLACRAPSLLGTGEGGAPCLADGDCASGACAGMAGVDGGRGCFAPCVMARTVCDAGLSCRSMAAALTHRDGTGARFDACAP